MTIMDDAEFKEEVTCWLLTSFKKITMLSYFCFKILVNHWFVKVDTKESNSLMLIFKFYQLLWLRPINVSQGGRIVAGGTIIESAGNFVQPTIVEISASAEVVKEELFAPVLYVMKFQVTLLPSSYMSEAFSVHEL